MKKRNGFRPVAVEGLEDRQVLNAGMLSPAR